MWKIDNTEKNEIKTSCLTRHYKQEKDKPQAEGRYLQQI